MSLSFGGVICHGWRKLGWRCQLLVEGKVRGQLKRCGKQFFEGFNMKIIKKKLIQAVFMKSQISLGKKNPVIVFKPLQTLFGSYIHILKHLSVFRSETIHNTRLRDYRFKIAFFLDYILYLTKNRTGFFYFCKYRAFL